MLDFVSLIISNEEIYGFGFSFYVLIFLECKDCVCFLNFLLCRFVDDTMRIGRDDKGNIFILERSEDD